MAGMAGPSTRNSRPSWEAEMVKDHLKPSACVVFKTGGV